MIERTIQSIKAEASRRHEHADLRARAEELFDELVSDGACYSRSPTHKREHCSICLMWEAAHVIKELLALLRPERGRESPQGG